MLKVKVEKFEGPLDLLLELIEKERLDITEVSLSKITDQYLSKVSQLDPQIYDVADFLVIAARLIYLKSKALLPQLENDEEEQEIEDLKTKLEIYKKYRDAAKEFGNILSKNQRSFPAQKPQFIISKFTPPKGVSLDSLWKTFQKLINDMPEELKREEVEIPSEKVTVEERLVFLERHLKNKKERRLSSIIKGSKSRLEAIVTFLAILEMIKCKQIQVIETKNQKDVVVKWKGK